MLQRRPNTFAQTNLLPHFSLATKRRTIHSGLPVNREQSGLGHSSMPICRLIGANALLQLAHDDNLPW